MATRRAILAAGASLAASAAPTTRDQFLGVWKLISYQRKSKDGQLAHPFTEKPVGRMTYDKAGRMSGQLMRPGRKSTMQSGISFVNGAAPDAEIREAANGFIAYFGTFDIDEANSTVIHHVEACLVPSWVGQDLKRKYRFEQSRLLLSAETAGMIVNLVWQRLPD